MDNDYQEASEKAAIRDDIHYHGGHELHLDPRISYKTTAGKLGHPDAKE